MIGFLLSGPGKIAVIVLAFVAWTGYQRYDAASDAREATWAKCRVEVQEKTDAEIQRQQKIAQAALALAEARAREAESERLALREKTDATIKRLQAQPQAGCRIDDDLMRELLDIR